VTLYDDGKTRYETDDPEQQRPRSYSVRTYIEPHRDSKSIEEVVTDLASRCIKSWEKFEGLNTRDYLPKLEIIFERCDDSERLSGFGIMATACIREKDADKD
jgi:hypothetical protein